MQRFLRRFSFVLFLLGAQSFWGCAEDNESEFKKHPGVTPPDAPQTAEEYELKNKPQKHAP